jgi:hypothetical protein
LWGDEAEYAEWFALWDGGRNADFWKEVQKRAPGYLGNKQFKIGWTYAEKLAENLGNLDLSKEALDKAFAAGSQSVGADLTDLFNSMGTLVENVSKFFLIDCGSTFAATASKCDERDAARRGSSGRKAIADANTIQKVVDEKISSQVEK